MPEAPPSFTSTPASEVKRYGSTAITLLKNGVFKPLPIKPNSKRPAVSDWSKIDITDTQVRRWSKQFPSHGVGHQCGEVGGLDIDVLNQELADHMHRFVVNELWDGVDYTVRYGKRPKRLIPVRLNGITKKMQSKKFIDPQGNIHGIEILAPGQQYLIFGKHPDTSSEYEWEPDDPLQIEKPELPSIDACEAEDILETFNEECEKRGWQTKEDSYTGHEQGRKESQCEASPQEAISALYSINPDCNRRVWVSIGTAVKAVLGEDGRNHWKTWSQLSANPDHNDTDAELDRQWDSLDTSTGANPETLFYHANQTGWRYRQTQWEQSTPEEDFQDLIETETSTASNLDDLNSRLIYVQDGNMVADLTKEPQNALLKIQEFHNSFKNYPMVERKGKKPVSASNDWLRSQNRITVRGARYLPNGSRIFSDQGEQWLNIYHTPKWPRPDNYDKIHILENHLVLLIPDDHERSIFIQWLCCTVLWPEIRPGFTPLHISHQHGMGRGWLVKVLQAILGVWNCSHCKMQDLANGQFQDFLHESLLCSMPEIKVDKNKYGIDDQIRDQLTDSPLNLNLKYGNNGTFQVFTNFFLASNNRDALVITKEDRRIFVVETITDPPPESYYRDTLYPAADDPEFLAQVFWWLKSKRDPKFNPFMRAPMTRAKSSMVESSKGDMDDMFDEMVNDDNVPDIVCYNTFVRYVKDAGYDWFDNDRKDRSTAAAILQGKALKVANGKKVRVGKVDRNDKRRLYAIRNYDKWHNASNEYLLQEYRLVAKE